MSIDTIKFVDDLPEWFSKREYKKQLSAADWYREVRARESTRTWLATIDDDRLADLPQDLRRIVIENIECLPQRDSALYFIPQHNMPVQPLSTSEALYLNHCATSDPAVQAMSTKIDGLLSAWRTESRHKMFPLATRDYHARVQALLDEMAEEQVMHQPVKTVPLSDLPSADSNPFLKYGRPLAGHPMTIDTRYDDATLLEHFKRWLKATRERSGERARRPISDIDFSDWANYRIRQVCDLDMWSKATGIRILDRVIADALWPNAPDGFSALDHLRTTVRKKVGEVFQYDFCVRFYGQLALEQGENFLLE